MLNITYKKEIIHKLYMLIAFVMFALIMYQGHIQKGGIYSILMFVSLFLMAFQIASILYVFFIKRRLELSIDKEYISWNIYDNKKIYKQQKIKLEDIKETKTEINYLTGNIYSNFTITFTLKDDSILTFTDGILYDIGIEKAHEIARYLLEHNLGEQKDIEFANIVKQLNLDIKKEQKFTKNMPNSTIIGVISNNKKEFLALRLQIEAVYKGYNDIKKNSTNEYLVENPEIKNSYIYLKSNAIGYMVEFYNVNKKPELKMLKEFKGATIKNKLANIIRN